MGSTDEQALDVEVGALGVLKLKRDGSEPGGEVGDVLEVLELAHAENSVAVIAETAVLDSQSLVLRHDPNAIPGVVWVRPELQPFYFPILHHSLDSAFWVFLYF